MRWFIVHKRLTLILAILLFLVVLLIASYSLKDKNNAIGDAARSVVSFVQKPFGAAASGIGNALGGVFSNDALANENKELEKKVEELSDELAIARIDAEELAELKKLAASLDGAADTGEKKLKVAGILSYDGSKNVNTFTIDIGTESGVERNTVVLCGDGLVGRVISAKKGWAQVVSIINENNNIGFELRGEGGKNYLGVIHGDGSGKLAGYLLNEDGAAKEGDVVFTSGVGGIYPGGIKIGTVTKSELTGDSPLLNINVDPAVYLKGIKKVAVLV
jgi:rod shape-determining protein MreC